MGERGGIDGNKRASPEEFLARAEAEEAKSNHGKLKIFFGYAAGVGKTYAMLQAAHRDKAAGIDVVVGYVEPHGRVETETLLQGLEALPFLAVPYRGVVLREFDLDATLLRHPALVLVDELAHTNAEGMRHTKRWQDVEELLEAGINVYTTLNVQHVESLNDVIAQVTGILVRETLPDAVMERADEIELIDITPEELVARLSAGKVYLPEQAARALKSFFERGNLLALRELAFREAAGRLQQDVEEVRRDRAVSEPWATAERILVCVGPSPTTPKVIRVAKRMAASLHAPLLAVAVNSVDSRRPSPEVKERVSKHMRLAERLGAESHVLVGQEVAETILDFARRRNVTKLVVGKSAEPRWRRLLMGGVVDTLLDKSGDIDVYVIQGERENDTPVVHRQAPKSWRWDHYLWTALVVAICAAASVPFYAWRTSEANIAMVFLLGVAYVAIRFGPGPSVFASIASVLVFDFFFVMPAWTFAVTDVQYLLTFAVLLVIGLLLSSFASRLQWQIESAQLRERRTSALYQLAKQLSQASGSPFIASMAGRQLSEIFGGEAVIYLVDQQDNSLKVFYGEHSPLVANGVNPVVAQWVYEHSKTAGRGTDTLPNATATFVPLIGSQKNVGVVGVSAEGLDDPAQQRLLETCAGQIALAVERDLLALEAHQGQVRMEADQLRSSLLSSVSHDLRTPLAAMAGAAGSLLDAANSLDETTRRELLQMIVDESHQLSRLVDNLLDMTRLESGAMPVQRQWQVLEELIGSAIARLRRLLGSRQVHVSIPAGFPLMYLDGLLFEQVLINLLENAARYTPESSTITITARSSPDSITLSIADNGPGIPSGSERSIFGKFVRGPMTSADGRRGVGLGLAICRSIVEAHDGRIEAKNRAEGGAEFIITLPVGKIAPQITADVPPEKSG